MEAINIELTIFEYVRFTILEDDYRIFPIKENSVQELADSCRNNGCLYFQTFKKVKGGVLIDGKDVTVESQEFDLSPIYAIDGEVFPFDKIPPELLKEAIFDLRLSDILSPKYAIRSRFGGWVFTQEETEAVKTSPVKGLGSD